MFVRKRLKIIKGRVINVSGERPLAGIRVYLFAMTTIESSQNEEETIHLFHKTRLNAVMTDQNGEFIFIVRNGTYSIDIDPNSLPKGKSIAEPCKIFRPGDSGYATLKVKDAEEPGERPLTSEPASSSSLSTIESILFAYREGEISEHAKIHHLLNALFDRVNTDTGYLSKIPDKSGTTAVEEIYRYLDKEDADPSIVSLARGLFSSHIPSLDKSYISPSGYFNIHYTLSGQNSVAAPTGSQKSVPSYIKEIGNAFDKAKYVTCGIRGFREPLLDAGKKTYDVYVIDLRGKYGITFPQCYYSQKSGIRTASSYICIDCSYSKRKGFLKSREDCMRVTAAHEFFHSVQYAYNFDADSWWKEASATWNEDEVFQGINDYVRYLGNYFSAPYKPLDKSSYSGVVFVKFLSEHCGGHGIIKKIWEKHSLGFSNSIDAIDRTLEENSDGPDLGAAFSRFAAYNVNPSQYYKEGTAWNVEINLDNSFPNYPVSIHSGSLRHLSSNYISFEPLAGVENRQLKIIVSNASKGQYRFQIQKRKKSDQTYQLSDIGTKRAYSESEITIKNFGKVYDQICLIPSSSETEKDGLEYQYSAKLEE